MTAEIATPLIAFGCALIVFLIFIICLVSHHVMRMKPNQPSYNPPQHSLNTYSYPVSRYSMHIKEEPIQSEYGNMQLKIDDHSVNKSDIGEILTSHIQEVENNDENYKNNETPLEFAYEGQDEETLKQEDLSSETKSIIVINDIIN
ncbi:hypothetical protein EWB00_007201 [Schistosoma japonicum]|uniref:Uncharacterized protein n=2 Tax=Schistosoma japonicum TaxID=6182 RepID=A0A4Z2CVG2_SCHJA|nr:hypothetical protein KSF78_0002510 [Schistosoma japonicum]TNN08239.1 hypothetical protein EWB00_007201 [Schistosoma japonicum]